MRFLEDVKEMLCRELEEFAEKGNISGAKDLDAIDKLTHSIKSIETIMAMQGYSYDDGGSYRSYDNRSYDNRSYARGRYQRRDSRGRYSNYDGYSGRMYYSRDDAKEDLMEQMRETMNNTSSEETKEAIRKAIQMMEKEQQ